MQFDLNKTFEILDNTPSVLKVLLNNLSEDWTHHNEGGESWSPYDVLGHLIHGEKTDYMARVNKILGDDPDNTFAPFDRFAQFEESKGKTLHELLEEFAVVRKRNMDYLRSKNLQPFQFELVGNHPSLGVVTLRNLLSCWTVHDLTHTAQITRVMAKQYKENIGPWIEYFRVLQDPQ